MKRGRAAVIIAEVQAAVRRWPEFAAEAQIDEERRDKIQKTHRLEFPKK
jgi:serine/threonine-protein kinase HipA